MTDTSSAADRAGPLSGVADRLDGPLGLLVLVVAVNAVGAAPAVLGGPNSAWFEALTKPALYPPSWVFGVVWTALFTLSAVAVWLLLRAEPSPGRRVALALFAVQFVFNVAWTPTFFTFQLIGPALAVIVVLAVALAGTVVAFARVDRRAAALLLPYLAWVCFAAVLNWRFLALN